MNKFCGLITLATISMIASNTMWAAGDDRDWYAFGAFSFIIPAAIEEHENLAIRFGAGVQASKHIGFELLWDTAPGIQPQSLIPQARLPQTIGPLTYDIESHSFHYFTALAVLTLPLRKPFSLFGKIGLARHYRSIEFDAWSSGNVFMESVSVDASAITPVISFGNELVSNHSNRLSIGYSTTYYFGKESEAILFSVFAKRRI